MKKYYIFGIFFLLVIVCNIFPNYQLDTIYDNRGNVQEIYMEVNDDRYAGISKYFDYIKTSDGGEVYLQSNYNFFCFLNDSIRECVNPSNSTVIRKFNSNGTVEWEQGGFFTNQSKITKDNILFAPYAVTELSNNQIASVGFSVDNDLKKAKISVVIFDETGTISSYNLIDIADYEHNGTGGHPFFDIITVDDGFTIKYSDLFGGTLLIHYNNDLEEQWYKLCEDAQSGGVYSGVYPAYYTDTLFFDNGKYYLLLDHYIVVVDDDGNDIWERHFNGKVRGITINNDGNPTLLIQGTRQVDQKISLFKIEEDAKSTHDLFLYELDATGGQILHESVYSALSGYEVRYNPRNLIQDQNGNYYTTILGYITKDDLEYRILLIKFDETLSYVGEVDFDGTYTEYYEVRHNDYMNYHQDLFIENDVLEIINLSTNMDREIELSKLTFIDDMPIDFNISMYNLVLHTRVVLNYSVLIWGLILVVLEFKKYYQKRKQQFDSVTKELEDCYWDIRNKEQ